MARRQRMSRKQSKRVFTQNAVRKNKRNFPTSRPMRGGIRL